VRYSLLSEATFVYCENMDKKEFHVLCKSCVQSWCRACSQSIKINRNTDEFFRRYITMDVTWLLHNTPEPNRQSVEWTERDKLNPKRGKMQRAAGVATT
jgi:hypothetical protein